MLPAQETSPPVAQDRQGGILTLTLQREASRNALSEEMMAALQSALEGAASDAEVRVVVLKATGAVFCAGHDLKEMTAARAKADGGRAYYTDVMRRCSRLMQTIVTLPKPVIAEVGGMATAAGLQLVASCDLAMASDTARFCTPGVNIGLFCSTPMVALTRNVPRKQAFEMLTTGEFIDAERAREIGLVNRVVPAEDLAQASRDLATTVASKLATAVRIGKRAFYEQIQMPLDRAYAYTGEVMTTNMLERDTSEGIQAFIEKRKPDWQSG